MKVVERTLRKVNRLLRRSRWTRNEFAVDAEGRCVPVKSPEAEAFCLLGACKRVNGPGEKQATALLRAECAKLAGYDVPCNDAIFSVNDAVERGFDVVKLALRRAIATAKRQRI